MPWRLKTCLRTRSLSLSVLLGSLFLSAISLPVLRADPAPLTLVFPGRGDTTELRRNAEALAVWLSADLKLPVQAFVAEDTAAVEALRANRADVAFLSSRPALKAEELAGAKLYLAEVRPNYSEGHRYKSVFVVRADSPLHSGKPGTPAFETGSLPVGDSKPSAAAATASMGGTALDQLRGKKMVFTSPTSGSGFIFPVAMLVSTGLVKDRDSIGSFFSRVMYGDNYTGALRTVLRGQADVAAVSEYALHPPYITVEEQKQLRVLYAISGVPAHGVAIDDDVPSSLRERLIGALLKLNEPAHNDLLRRLYNATRLVPVDHAEHVQPLRNALKLAGIEP